MDNNNVLDRATEESWHGCPVRIASIEGLILLKLTAFRPQDQIDIENLIASKQGTLNIDWIRTEWQSFAALDDPRLLRLMDWVNA